MPHMSPGAGARRERRLHRRPPDVPDGERLQRDKFGVRALTEGMNLDVAGTPLRVSAVDPGFVKPSFRRCAFHGDRARAKAVYQGFKPLSADDVADAIAYW